MDPAFSTWLLHKELGQKKMTFDEALRFTRQTLDCGIVEIPRTTYPDWSQAGVRNLKRLLYKHGLFCVAVAAQNHFNCPTHIERRREVQLTKDFVDVASFLGARVLNVFHAGWGDREQGRRLKKEMLECLKDVVAYAERQAVVLAVEAHGPITDNAEEFRELMASCDSEYICVNLDTGNMMDGPAGNLKLLDLTGHAHVKLTYQDASGQKRDAEARRVLAELKKTGFCGPVTYEHESDAPLEEKAKGFAEFKAMLASL